MNRFPQVFERLKDMLLAESDGVELVINEPEHIYFDTPHIMKNNKPLFFAAVKVNKGYVSFHLMPVYVFPDLLKNVSPELRKRMQGKSCFNFTKIDETLFSQLKVLLKEGRNAYRQAGYL